MARFRASLLVTLAAGSSLLSACSPDVTAPAASAGPSATPVSSFRPSRAAKSLYGVSDGVYTITFDPSESQSFEIGLNHLDMPANSVCDIANSTYGVGHWNETCTPQTDSVTITLTISGSTTDNPRLDFFPAVRFSPDKSVQLFMYTPSLSLSDSWKLLYCDALNVCVDEATTDSDLQSYVDHDAGVIFRRIKHFSGYFVTDFSDEPQVTP